MIFLTVKQEYGSLTKKKIFQKSSFKRNKLNPDQKKKSVLSSTHIHLHINMQNPLLTREAYLSTTSSPLQQVFSSITTSPSHSISGRVEKNDLYRWMQPINSLQEVQAFRKLSKSIKPSLITQYNQFWPSHHVSLIKHAQTLIDTSGILVSHTCL